LLLILLAVVNIASANVEKAIFLGPAPVNIPLQKPTISDLRLDGLTPEKNSLRLQLPRSFPSADGASEKAIRGQASWFLVDSLIGGQRYEVRTCWSALEPTAFTIDVFELGTVWDTPELIQSLAEYAFSRQLDGDDENVEPSIHQPSSEEPGERKSSLLFLRVVAAADYYTDHEEIMSNPPPVLIDLILDPFLLNVLPRSLLPTACYVIAVAVASLLVARWIATSLQSMMSPGTTIEKKSQ